jgi:hypothetical protein
MPHNPSPKPSEGAKPDKPPAAAVGSQPVCPNCGRGPAVVFPALNVGQPAGKPRLVCLLCCPKRTGHA